MQDSDIGNILGILHPFRRKGASSVSYQPTDGGFVVEAYQEVRGKEVRIDLRFQWDDGYEVVICRLVSSSQKSEPFELRVTDYMLLQEKMFDFIKTL